MATLRGLLPYSVPGLTLLGIAIQLLSLRWGWLDRFLPNAMGGAAIQPGADYWSLPTAWLNLLAGRSAYDTWGHPLVSTVSTWYVAHPLLAIAAGSWLSLFPIHAGFWVWTVVSLALLGLAARELAGLVGVDPKVRPWVFFLLLASFSTYVLLSTGNSHAVLILGFALAIRGLDDLRSIEAPDAQRAGTRLMAGLLLSFFSKPLLLLVVPCLLLIPESRRLAFGSLAIYALASAACLLLPPLNPEGIGLREVVSLAFDPRWVREHMNIYLNQFALNPYMKDNSVHWFHMVAQSGFVLPHVEIFSLAAFLSTLAGGTSWGWIPPLFLVVTLGLSLAVVRLPSSESRLTGAGLALLLVGCSFFLGYTTIWEYHYVGAQLVAAAVWCLRSRGAVSERTARIAAACAVLWFLPSPAGLFAADPASPTALLWTRGARVLPAVALWTALAADTVRLTKGAWTTSATQSA